MLIAFNIELVFISDKSPVDGSTCIILDEFDCVIDIDGLHVYFSLFSFFSFFLFSNNNNIIVKNIKSIP